jgi:hypothetical protein
LTLETELLSSKAKQFLARGNIDSEANNLFMVALNDDETEAVDSTPEHEPTPMTPKGSWDGRKSESAW